MDSFLCGFGIDERGEGQNQLQKGKQGVQISRPGIGRELNPLMIDLVLERIFHFCSANTLRKCRLVNKTWKHVSLKAWRNTAILRPRKKAVGLHNFKKYLKFLQDDEFQMSKYPFKNFQIQTHVEDYLTLEAKPVSDIARLVKLRGYKGSFLQVKEFLVKFHSLTILELENYCDWPCWSNEKPFSHINLKRLKIIQSNGGPCEVQNWTPLLKCFPNLEAFTVIENVPKIGSSEIKRILDSAKLIRSGKNGEKRMKLKELEITFAPEDVRKFLGENVTILQSIVECRFPLEKLRMCLKWEVSIYYGIERHVHQFLRLLTSCKDTLQYLKTNFAFNVRDISVDSGAQTINPSMSMLLMRALKEVHITNGIWGLNFLADLQLPNLEKLILSHEESTACSDINISRFQLPLDKETVFEKLETLEVIDNRKIPGPKTIKAICKMMCNLVSLTIPLDQHTFPIVCKRLRKLKTLHVLAAQCSFVEIDDESFTGIWKKEGPRAANITDLTSLADLSIDHGMTLTDVSVSHGLLQLPPLHSLKIGFKELSDDNMEKLRSHVTGYLDIHVKPKVMPESYFDLDVDVGSSESDDDMDKNLFKRINFNDLIKIEGNKDNGISLEAYDFDYE